MKGFILSFRSEFYKTRKTMAFWSAVILPFVICLMISIGFFSHSDKLSKLPGAMLWFEFSAPVLVVMGSILLPMLIVFEAYSVNNIEHKAETWKTLFSLPLSKWSVYSAKYLYALFLIILCLALFVLFTLGFGNLLGVIQPQLKFSEYHIESTLLQVYFKLLLSGLGILSIQFLLSLLFRDFLKPMGIGFVATVAGIIMANVQWKYTYLFPYSNAMLTIRSLKPDNNTNNGQGIPHITVDLFTKDICVSLIVAVTVFILGYFIVLKKSVK
ncbi:ABC transporter permease [Mucilaginibacter ginsenosidivorans]|uniref:ABC transporter permease subunit n=1 Tax=Mucilaginibacter ginsenosidivorans TaxID=398053 RepID=A0A5B8UQ19_9SPHI|nr:ABC transporter permease [Mucilaginibacter ginsenosidivorans]QEC61203.1 ABC transporter permease subunit [Mucilaginibacter ginsenosidivorans]